MKNKKNYPQALVKAKAEEFYNNRTAKGEAGTSEADWAAAEKYYQKHPHEVFLWKLLFWWRLLLQLPELFEDSDSRGYALDVLKTVISSLTLFGTGLAAFALIFNFWDAQEERRLTQERLITDRFTKSVEQLGKVNLATKKKEETVRSGGIYALERIAHDSPKDHWTIMEVLSSYVRNESPAVRSEVPEDWQEKEEWLSKNRISNDIQAALTVIGRRKTANDCFGLQNKEDNNIFKFSFDKSKDESGECEKRRINLIRGNLIAASLREADLSRADLSGADLSGANLSRANLSRADLSGANLRGADLRGANLSGANLIGADLSGANLFGADLSGADLSGANLIGADLSGAKLIGAKLIGANLIGADFSGANLRGAKLIGAKLIGANLRGANLFRANLFRANLRGANLFRANLKEADLSDVLNLSPETVKSSCHWQQAQFSQAFQKTLAKEPDQNVDCSKWNNEFLP